MKSKDQEYGTGQRKHETKKEMTWRRNEIADAKPRQQEAFLEHE